MIPLALKQMISNGYQKNIVSENQLCKTEDLSLQSDPGHGKVSYTGLSRTLRVPLAMPRGAPYIRTLRCTEDCHPRPFNAQGRTVLQIVKMYTLNANEYIVFNFKVY